MIHYRKASRHDITYLLNLDLKCNDQPSSQDWWYKLSDNRDAGCLVGCHRQIPMSMVAWERGPLKIPEHRATLTTLHIHKLCVRHEFRGQRVGQKLLGFVHEEAQKLCAPCLSISVPEYMCGSRSEFDVGAWLNTLNFEAKSILPDAISMWGDSYDQYLFVFGVKN